MNPPFSGGFTDRDPGNGEDGTERAKLCLCFPCSRGWSFLMSVSPPASMILALRCAHAPNYILGTERAPNMRAKEIWKQKQFRRLRSGT